MADDIGTAEPLYSQEWDERALADTGFLVAGLRELGVDGTTLAQAVEVQDDIAAMFANAMTPPKQHFYGVDGAANWHAERFARASRRADERLHDWILGLKFETEDVSTRRVEVPIFLLNSPKRKNCSVVLTRSVASEKTEGWDLGLVGSGLSKTRTVRVTVTSRLESHEGHAKLVFQPVHFLVSKVITLKHGKKVGEGLQVEPIELTENPGAESCNKAFAVQGVGVPYPLLKDTSDDPAGYDWKYEYEEDYTFSLGIEAHGLATSLTATRSLSASLQLHMELAAGANYFRHRLKALDGLGWRASSK